jgi:hypothetical protein
MYNNDPKYTDPPEAGLASLLASRGRNGDSMVVHMAPEEVSGLQQLARSMGAQESDLYNPVTGQPQFSFLKKILPMVAGAILGPSGMGVFKSAFGAATAVGLGYGLIKGDLEKGLMAGLGAYSGANLANAFKAAATPAADASSLVQTAPPPAASLKDTAFKISASPIEQDVALSSLRQTPISSVTGKAMANYGSPFPTTVTQAPPMPTPASTAPTSNFGAVGQGIRNIFTGQEGAGSKFMEALGSPMSRFATFAGASIPFTEEPKPINVPGMGENIVYIPGGFNPEYGTGADQPPQLPGKYYKRTAKGLVPYNPYAMAPGYAAGGPVLPAPNYNYPLSGVTKTGYSAPMEYVKPREVLDGYDTKIDPFTGEERFADGGAVNAATPRGENPDVLGLASEDPLVLANRKYVEELNRRALNPVVNPYGLNYAGGIGGTNTPWTGTNPYGGPLTPPADGQTTSGGGAGDIAAFLATQVGMNWLMQPGNAMALKDWISGGMKWDQRPFLNAEKTGTGTGQTGQTGQTQTNQTQTGGDTTGTGTTTGTTTTTGGDATDFDYGTDYSKYTQVGGDLSKLSSLMNARAGLESLGTLGGLSSTGFGGISPTTLADAAKATSLSAGMTPSGSIASQYGGMKGALEAGKATTSAAEAGLGSLKDKIIPGVATALGAYNTAKAIEAGKEGRAAFSAASTAASAAKLGAPLGPVGMLAAAAIAAIGASMVNTKEQGDVALRNYWDAVDQGRGLGSAPPEELANGFINFYRTNKNQFAGQEKYGRKGNEDFVYDMTQVVNKAVQDGTVSKDADAHEIYKKAVQPWLNSMGSGPQDADAKRIQDYMMTDLIYNFMQGKPISNAQVKGDKNYKIVSQKPVFAGNAPAAQQTQQANTQGMGRDMDSRALADFLQAQNPYGTIMPFADGGAVGEDYNFGFADGGMPEYKAGGKLLDGPGDGMSDDIPAVIRGKGVQRAALADGEFVIPADVVSHLGNGSTKAGAKKLYQMMSQVRKARTGKTRQAPAVKADRLLPA